MRSGIIRTGGSVAVVAALLLGVAGGADAQNSSDWIRSTTEGFHLAGYLNGSAIEYRGDGEIESGPGFGLGLGYGVSRLVTLYVDVAAADVQLASGTGSYVLAHADVGAQFTFGGPQRSVLGYLTTGFNGRATNTSVNGSSLVMHGGGLSLGGGLLVFLSRTAALDFGLRWSAGSFSEAKYRGTSESIDVGASSARLNVGLSWWGG